MEEEAARKESVEQMTKSLDGKAVFAVQKIIALVKTAKEKFINSDPALQRYNVKAVTVDDMVFMAKNLLDKQTEFISKQISGQIGGCRAVVLLLHSSVFLLTSFSLLYTSHDKLKMLDTIILIKETSSIFGHTASSRKLNAKQTMFKQQNKMQGV